MNYLVAIHRPTGYDGTTEDAEMGLAIDQVNDEMVAAGVRVFVGGLRPPETAKAIRIESDGQALITDGPYLETKEHVGGFWVLDVTDIEAAVEWGRKAAIACRAEVEVRPFF
jgi:hypothetical protein